MSSIPAMLYREGKIRATNITFVFWDISIRSFICWCSAWE